MKLFYEFCFVGCRKTKICGAASIKCYNAVEHKLFTTNKYGKWFRDQCNCLPACESIQYNARYDRIKISDKFKSFNSIAAKGDGSTAKFSIYFNDREIIPVKRVAVSTFSNFIAICGGLLGLFIGASALSIVEFVYFATLRLFWSSHDSTLGNVTVTFDEHTEVNSKFYHSFVSSLAFLT